MELTRAEPAWIRTAPEFPAPTYPELEDRLESDRPLLTVQEVSAIVGTYHEGVRAAYRTGELTIAGYYRQRQGAPGILLLADEIIYWAEHRPQQNNRDWYDIKAVATRLRAAIREAGYHDSARQYFKDRQRLRRGAGLCHSCGNEASKRPDGQFYSRCDFHRAAARQYNKDNRERVKAYKRKSYHKTKAKKAAQS